jgi:predicted alpha/beta hydrolase family esterase
LGISAFEWGHENDPVVLLIHGWSGRGTQMGAFAAPLVAAGFRVVAIDGPAHGTSDGTYATLALFAESMKEAQKILGPFHAVIAHSFGAGSVVLAVVRGLVAKKIVLVAGPARYERVIANFFKILPISPSARKIFLVNLQNLVGIAVQDMNVGELGQNLPVQAMVVHDVEDKEVKFQSALEIKEAWPQVKLLETQGLGHRRVLRDPHVLQAVTDFIKA